FAGVPPRAAQRGRHPHARTARTVPPAPRPGLPPPHAQRARRTPLRTAHDGAILRPLLTQTSNDSVECIAVRRYRAGVRRLLIGALAVLTVLSGAVATRPAPAYALDNGLALTPPMGCNDWKAFRCNVTEQLIAQTADFVV